MLRSARNEPPLEPSSASFEGHVVLVCGFDQQAGVDVVRRFLAESATVVAVGNNPDTVVQRAAAIGGHPRLLALSADTAKVAQVHDLVATVMSLSQHIDVLVNLGHVAPQGHLLEIDNAQWRSILDEHLTSAFLLAKAVLPAMKSRRGGVITNLSSLAAVRGDPNLTISAAYCAAMAAMQGLTRQIALEYKTVGIRANTLVVGENIGRPTPSEVDEPVHREQSGDVVSGANVAAITDVICFLSSQAAAAINGETILATSGTYVAP